MSSINTSLLLDPTTDCHQRSRWEMPQPPEPSAPPPLVIHRPRFSFVPLIRRPERIIYGYGDASQSGAAGHWNNGINVVVWRIPMGVHSSPADSLSRGMTQTAAFAHSDGIVPRWRRQGGYAPDALALEEDADPGVGSRPRK
jgi:hypothetical protein